MTWGKLDNKIKRILLIACLIIAAYGVSAYAATNPTTSVADVYSELNGNIIYVLNVGEEKYLFLPNEADPSNVTLSSEIEGQNVVFVVDEEKKASLDLAALTPTDGVYSVDVKDGDETFELKIMQGSGIGTLYFTSDDKASKGRTWIDKSKSNHGSGTALVVDSAGEIINSKAKNQVVTDIHGRGNSSWGDPKKGYQIKFDKKISLVSGTAEAKKWVLLAQYKDPLRMSDKLIKDIAKSTTRNDYSPQETWVNFYYDGEYRGVYLLGEKNEVKSGRVDITDMEEYYEEQDENYGDTTDLKTDTNSYGNLYQYQDGLTGPDELGGYLFEMNEITIDENNGFKFKVGTTERAANIKSPELGSQEAVEYISEYFQEFCDAVTATDADGNHTGKNAKTGLYYYDYCDIDSLVDSYLIQSLSSENDSYWKSQYFYKDANGKMIAGSVWDMDLSLGTGWSSQISSQRDYSAATIITKDLIKIPSFQKKVKERYAEIYSDELDKLSTTFKSSYENIESALAMDHTVWPVMYKCGNGTIQWEDTDTLEDVLAYRIDWVSQHKTYLDSYFNNMTVEEAHIYADAVAKTDSTHTRTCTLHDDETITEDCIFLTSPNGDGTHTTACTACSNSTTEDCSYDIVINEDGTHTKTCSGCGEVIAEDHTWKEEIITNPTCTEKGSKRCTCTVCGTTETKEIDALGHDWGAPNWTWSEDYSTAVAAFTCANDSSHKETVSATIETQETAPTCEEEGETTYTATITAEQSPDGNAYSDEKSVAIKAKGHTLTHHAAVAATCDIDGNIEYWQCEVCEKKFSDEKGKTEVEDVIIPASHTLKKAASVPATCLTNGAEEYWVCSVCNKKFDADNNEIGAPAVIPATGHDWGDWETVKLSTCIEKGQRVRVCKNDSTHLEYEDVDLLNHTMTHHDAKAATCTEAGNIEYWTCSVCGKYFAKEDGSEEIGKDVKIPAYGHQYGNWASVDGGKHQRVCIYDSDHKEIADHNWDKGEVVTPATTTSKGVMLDKCKDCNELTRVQIPMISASQITINKSTVTAASIKKIIAEVEASGGSVDTIILGKKVKKIKKRAFKGTDVKKIIVKTKKLKKAKVKKSLAGSKVTTIKVTVGKKYIKTYKTIFAKKNSGKKVKVS